MRVAGATRCYAILACCYSGALLQRRIAHCCSGALRVARCWSDALLHRRVAAAARCCSGALLQQRVATMACCYSGALQQRRIAHCCSGALRVARCALRVARCALRVAGVARCCSGALLQRRVAAAARCYSSVLLQWRVATVACCYSGALLQRRIAHCCSGALRVPPAERYKRSALQEQHVVRAARCKSRAFTSPPLHLPGSAKKRLQVRPSNICVRAGCVWTGVCTAE